MLNKKDLEELEGFSKLECSDTSNLFKLSELDPQTDFVDSDFSKLMLQGIDFSCFNFKGSNFSKSILYDVNFSCANLKGVDFSNANLRRANFTDAIIDDTVDFSNAYLGEVLGLDNFTKTDNVDCVGSILFIEDEPNSVLKFTKELYDTFPFINLDIAENKKNGVEMLRSNKYLFTIIDAKIPETTENQTDDLLGQEISELLSSGKIEVPYTKMKHVILTEHKTAVLKTIARLPDDDKLVAIVEKGDKDLVYKENIFYNIFNAYLEAFLPNTEKKPAPI